MAKRAEKTLHGTLKRRLLGLALGAMIIGVLLDITFQLIVGTATVSGNSMLPTYKNKESVLYFRLEEPRRNDVVAIHMISGERYVKRIAAMPGDTVDLRDGVLYVNEEPYEIKQAQGVTNAEQGVVTYPLTLEDQEYFVLGDNREHSEDSRFFGPVVKKQIMGVIIGAR